MLSNKKVRLCIILTIMLCVFAGVFLSDIPAWLKYKKGEIKDYNQVQAGELKKGDLVRGTIDQALGACAEEYSTSYGVRTSSKSSKLYYVLWMDNEKFILYEASGKSFDQLDKITDETVKYYESLADAQESGDMADVVQPTSTMALEGRVTEIPSKIRGFFKEWYDETFEDNEFDSSAEAVMISPLKFDRLQTLVILGFVLALLAVGSIILTVIVIRKEKYNQQYGY